LSIRRCGVNNGYRKFVGPLLGNSRFPVPIGLTGCSLPYANRLIFPAITDDLLLAVETRDSVYNVHRTLKGDH